MHEFMALTYVTAGSAVMHQRERCRIDAGDVYLVPAGERHRFISARSPEAWGIGFCPTCYTGTELGALLAPFERAAMGALTVVTIAGDRQAHLNHLCAELHRETSRSAASAHVEVIQKSLLALVLAEVSRASATSPAQGVGYVGEVLRFIERNCLGPLSLADVASSVNRSPSHVSTVVRRTTGKSVMEWIIAGRLAEARSRLLHTDEFVDVISERVGYADPTHFIRLFRRAHGCTPAAWRAGHRALPATAEQ